MLIRDMVRMVESRLSVSDVTSEKSHRRRHQMTMIHRNDRDNVFVHDTIADDDAVDRMLLAVTQYV